MVYGCRLPHGDIQMTYGFEYLSLGIDPETAEEGSGRMVARPGFGHAVGNAVRIPALKLDARHMVNRVQNTERRIAAWGD